MLPTLQKRGIRMQRRTMMEKTTSNWLSPLFITFTCVIIGYVTLIILNDYGRESDFFTYRLALNISEGHGLVYNAGQQAILTLSPLGAVPFSIAPNAVQTISVIFFLSGLATISVTLHTFLKTKLNHFPTPELILILCLVSLSYPTWVGMRSLEAVAFGLVILALIFQERELPLYAALSVAIASLFHPTGLIGVFIVGIYAFGVGRSVRYWILALLPCVIWLFIGFVNFGFDGFLALTLKPDTPATHWQDWLWLGLFILAIISMIRVRVDRRLFIIPLWASFDLGLPILLSGNFAGIDSIAASATIVLGSVLGLQTLADLSSQYRASILIIIFTALLIIAPPQTPDAIRADLAQATTLNLQADTSILHNRTSALTYNLDVEGHVYRLDGSYQPEVTTFTTRDDFQSLIVATAPDYIYIEDEVLPVDFDNQNLSALVYGIVEDQLDLWTRNATVGTFPEQSTSVNIDYSPDVQLTGYALDRERINANDTVRLRLDWSLNRLPDEGMGININLNDLNGTPITSIFTQFPRENWQTDTLSTYHALRLPGEVEAGLLQVQVTLDYRAGILGRHTFGNLLVPIQQPENVENPIGTLDPVTLYLPVIYTENGQLFLDLVWQTSNSLNANYRVFIHITGLDDLQPLAQDDGLPLGGRYPTQYWQPQEYVPETRNVDISALPAGEYRVNIGLYTPETGRLSNENADYLQAASLTITQDGIITINTN